jgi:hypothetical protein
MKLVQLTDEQAERVISEIRMTLGSLTIDVPDDDERLDTDKLETFSDVTQEDLDLLQGIIKAVKEAKDIIC